MKVRKSRPHSCSLSAPWPCVSCGLGLGLGVVLGFGIRVQMRRQGESGASTPLSPAASPNPNPNPKPLTCGKPMSLLRRCLSFSLQMSKSKPPASVIDRHMKSCRYQVEV
eukprot:scaffold49533_cov34-Phaeocystis_antarctica.AAC.1